MAIAIRYGEHPSQVGDIYLPEGDCKGIVCFFHGGLWKMPYDRFQANEIATKLTAMGYCVWNVEYRRVGEPKRTWNDTFQDAVSSIRYLNTLKDKYQNINLDNVIVAGHSAGGHLAIWLSTQEIGVKCTKFIGLAPILDLKMAYHENAGSGSISHLLEGSPEDYPERYKETSPIEMLGLTGNQIILHGIEDEAVPIEWSRNYVETAKEREKIVELIEIENCSHMDFIDSKSIAFQKFVECIER